MRHEPGFKDTGDSFYIWLGDGRNDRGQVRNVGVKWNTMTPIVSYEVGAGIIENMIHIM